jgi:RNA polymerase sigma-70 factor (ECF subfamily)
VDDVPRCASSNGRTVGSPGLDAGAWTLLSAAKRGDRAALGVLYRRYAGEVRRYVYARVSNEHLAEDFTSEVFVRLIKSIDSVRPVDGKFRGWLMTISRNIVIDHFKSRYNQLEVPVHILPENGAFELSAEHRVVRRCVDEVLLDCLDQLVPDQRRCLRLRFLEEMSVAETAAAMGKSATAIRQLQLRGVRKMAALLAPQELLAS